MSINTIHAFIKDKLSVRLFYSELGGIWPISMKINFGGTDIFIRLDENQLHAFAESLITEMERMYDQQKT